MRQKFTDRLSPPTSEDEESNRTAWLLHWSLLAIIVAAIGMPLLLTIVAPGNREFLYWVFGLADVGFFALLFMLHRGHIRLVSWLLPLLVWTGFTVVIYKYDGIYDTAVTGYFIVILLAALLLGRWASIIFCTLSVLSVLAAAYLQSLGIIVPEGRIEPFSVDIIMLLLNLAMAALLLDVAISRITEGYTQARQNQKALERLAHTLEEKVVERTDQFNQANSELQHKLDMLKPITEELGASEEKYRLVVENAAEAIFVAQDGKLKYFNNRLVDFAGGYTEEEMQSLPFVQFIHPDDRELVISRHMARLQEKEVPPVYNFRIVDKHGQATWVDINAVRIDWEGRPAILNFLTDVTERVMAEQSLCDSEARFRHLIEYAPVGIYEVDLATGRFASVNELLCEYLGYSREELLSMAPSEILFEEGQHLFAERVARIIAGESVLENAEFRVKDKLGREIWGLINTSVLYDKGKPVRLAVVAQNINQRKKMEQALRQAHNELEEKVQARTVELAAANGQLKASLKEKEVLLKEIHHRVKNNMQVISSLFSLQSHNTTDSQALEILRESRQRVHSMALIHEKLYRSENLASIDFSDYIDDLARTLFYSYKAAQREINLYLNTSQLFLGIEQAIPCGLIVNELISNALKHAFPNGQRGQINIALCVDESEQFVLSVVDDGVGLPPDFDLAQTASLGLTLVTGLVDQLDGEIDLVQENGIKFMINIPLKAD